MKKRIFAALLACVMIFSLTACGKDSKKNKEPETTEAAPLVYYEIGGKNHLDLTDYSEYVTLGEYKGIEVSVSPIDDIDKQVKEYIDSVLKNNATYEQVKEGTVKETDTINLDYTGKYNGVAFEKGAATDYTYKIHGGFIESLDKQLVGLEVGKEYDLECTFPEKYTQNPDLAGKDVVFTVKVNYIQGKQILPEWNDDFINTLTKGQYKTTADFEKELRVEIEEEAKATQKSSYSTGLWTTIIANCKINGYPEEKVEAAKKDYIETMKSQCEQAAEAYGLEYKDVLVLYGFESEEKLEAYCLEKAQKELEYIMTACLIAEKENIAVTDEIYNNLVENVVKNYEYDSVEAFEKAFGTDYIMESFVFEAVGSWLEEQNKMVISDKKEEATKAESGTKEDTTKEDVTEASTEETKAE